MPNALPSELVAITATATVYAIVGVVALGAAFRMSGRDRSVAVLLAWAMLQHAVNEALSSVAPSALGFGGPVAAWVGVVTGYFIAVPWAFLIERMLGSGWRQSIRITAVVFVLAATSSVVFDLAVGRLGAAASYNRLVVAVGACVALAHLFAWKSSSATSMKVMRVGVLVFLGLVVHDTLARERMLPWRVESGVWAVLVCVGAIGYTVVNETMRRRRDLQNVEQELSMARRIQSSLLPTGPPSLDGATVAFRYVPATAVAGDVLDFVGATQRQVGILVADVSGHGVPAALIASMVKVAAAAQKPHAEDPARVLAGIHLALAEQLPPAHFVTAVYAHLDLDARRLRVASAGHPPPVIWRAARGTVLPDPAGGPLIIPFAPPDYPLTEVALEAGDRLLFYTDGVTEACGANDELFGVERLRVTVAAEAGDVRELLERVLEAVRAFVPKGRGALDDDCTMVAVQID